MLKKIKFFSYKIKIEMKTTITTALKNKLEYSAMSVGDTCIVDPNLEVLSKGLV